MPRSTPPEPESLDPEALSPVASALLDMAAGGRWGTVTVHFERGRLVSVVTLESRRVKVASGSALVASPT